MYLLGKQILELGVSRKTLNRKIRKGEWETLDSNSEQTSDLEQKVLLSTLPESLQLAWAKRTSLLQYPEQIAALLSESTNYGVQEQEAEIVKLLSPLSLPERIAWIREALRLASIIERYDKIDPKRERNHSNGKWRFVPGVIELGHEAACKEQIILVRQPHRAKGLSPHTLDGLSRAFRKRGLLALLPKVKKTPTSKKDKRRTVISESAQEWLNNNWRRFSGPTHLYKALKEEADKQGWKIPSKSWVYRLWRNLPKVVKTYYLEGKQAYESKLCPYVPRDFSDLKVLQVLCGDHTERDVTVLLPDHSLARPWLTLWYDLRAGLIWGKCLCLVPSSFTAGLAYADGVQNFGAQPISRPADGFYSYIYTDRGRDYKSHNWDGKVIAVHKQAMNIEGGLEMLRVQRRVGILDELNIRHLLAKRRNAKEKPVERVHKDISDWEQNTFKEYCGRNSESRPEQWYELYTQHQRFIKGKYSSSPFIPFNRYSEELDQFITRYNSTQHERPTLGSAWTVPLEEYKRLYTTRYEIAPETLAILLMKAEKRTIQKNGVQCFQKHWFYYHEAMSLYKGLSVEVRYSDDNFNRVWVVLPNTQICEATLITPTSLLNPNKETLKVVRQAKSYERKLQREFDLFTQSQLRGETTEDRVTQQLELEASFAAEDEASEEDQPRASHVHQLTRFDRHKQRQPSKQQDITSNDVAEAAVDTSIFELPNRNRIKEFDYED